MQIATAVKHLHNEAESQGMPFLDTLQDIERYGRRMYSERTMEAFVVVMQLGQEMFAPVDE